MLCLTKSMHASTCLFLWCWYDDVIVCQMLIFLQKSFSVSDVKFLPLVASETVFLLDPIFCKNQLGHLH